jgi:tetratricopeptide (TPR) repeat protein
MKVIKYFLIGALMIGITTPSTAQEEDHKAVIEQLTKVVKSDAADKEDQIKDLFKDYKKDPDVIVAIGRAYLDIKDTENAQKYADMAIKRDKKYGDAYVLAGDIQVILDNGGEASSLFEQAIYFDPKNPNGYRRYAQVNSKANPSAAVQKLEELKQQVPDYPIALISAEIFSKAGDLDKAIQYYNQVDKSKMEDYQLVDYALVYFLKGEFEKSLEISQFGNNKFPRNPALNRISFFDLTNLKRYDEALQYAAKLFNESEETKITESDYLYYGYAHLGKGNYDEAIAMFQKSIENNQDNEADKNDAMKNIAEAYKKKGDYRNAIGTYEKYLDNLKQKTANDIHTLATMYMAEASDSTIAEAQKKVLYAKADSIYAEMADKMPSVAVFATLQRAHIGYALDPETKLGLAKPHYEKLVELLTTQEKDENTDERLIESYRYLGYYYLLKDDKTKSAEYWNKILAIDPENAMAKQALGLTQAK